MKKIILFLILIPFLLLAGDKIGSDCTLKGKKLSGRIRIVTANEDFRVRVVNANEDLKVLLQTITWNERCGEWYYADANYDFKVRFVEANEDFKIRFVNAIPGVR